MPILHASILDEDQPDLFTPFLRAAHWTWERREMAKEAGFPFSEETITETILLDLATMHPAEIQVYPLNKHQEGRIGADWEWCFYNRKQSRFLRTLVQAKVLDNRDREYAHIDRYIGNTGVRQIDRLLEAAGRRQIPALYVFYNHLSDPSRLPVESCTCLECRQCWGCSMAFAPGVAATLPDKSFDALKRISKPWACLLCPVPDEEPAGDSLPDEVAATLRLLVRLATEVVPAVSYDARDYGDLVRTEPPQYFSPLRQLQLSESKSFRESTLESIVADNPGVDGIVLITDRKRE